MIFKKKDETENKAKPNDVGTDVMEELDDSAVQEFSGAGNPFDRPRAGYQPIDDDLRGNG